MLFMFSLVAYVRWFMELCIVSCIKASMVFKFAFGDWFKGCRPSFRVKYSFRMATGLTGPLHQSDRLSADRSLHIVLNKLFSAISSMIRILVAVTIIFM